MTKLRLFLFLLFYVSLCVPQISQGQIPVYSKIHVPIPDKTIIDQLNALHLDIDHFSMHQKGGITFFVADEELTLLKQSGIPFNIEINDYSRHYNEQREKDLQSNFPVAKLQNTAAGFGYGSMGGFYTLQEVEQQLDSMHFLYPTLTTDKFSIGLSEEGRDIWALKITDNPLVNENEPRVYYDALHHAREPLSMAVTINFMYWLLENYNSSLQVQHIVNNRELIFVPVVNPDGYEFNRIAFPNGGGMWRKNRSFSSGNCYGVDLNRNYSTGWGVNSSCSSTNMCSDTYRGASAFSEMETNAVKQLVDSLQPNMAFSIHSTAGSYLIPYGYNSSPPDYELYSEWSSDFLDECDYPYGTTWEMLNYTSCGVTRDYLHSQGTYAWTPEIGGSSFWPQQSEIFGLVDENVRPLFYLAWIAGAYADVQNHVVTGNVIAGGAQIPVTVTVKNKGVGEDANNVLVELIPQSQFINVASSVNFGSIPARSKADNSANPFMVEVLGAFPDSSFNLDIVVSQDGVKTTQETITLFTGNKMVMFIDDAENGASNWIAAGNGKQWGVANDDSYSGIHSFGDSNGGNSSDNTSNSFTLATPITLMPANRIILEFMAKWSIEWADTVKLQMSTNSGGTWVTLQSYTLNNSWMQQIFDLTSYASNNNLTFRFIMETDNSIPADGFYFDDFSLTGYSYNTSLSLTADFCNDLILFPKPAVDKITLHCPSYFAGNDSKNEISIYDISGRKVLNDHGRLFNNDQLSIDISTLNQGMYLLQLQNKQTIISKSFTVIK